MSFHAPVRCRKVGLILTCFVNGRKRFRAVAVADQPKGPKPTAGADTDARSSPPAAAGL